MALHSTDKEVTGIPWQPSIQRHELHSTLTQATMGDQGGIQNSAKGNRVASTFTEALACDEFIHSTFIAR
jgi:hypothetical protein